MQIEMVTKNYVVNEKLRDVIEKKVSKLDKYFDDDTKAEICRKFYDAMEDGGFFYIGHAESVPKDMPFVKVAPAIYRKLGGDKK